MEIQRQVRGVRLVLPIVVERWDDDTVKIISELSVGIRVHRWLKNWQETEAYENEVYLLPKDRAR